VVEEIAYYVTPPLGESQDLDHCRDPQSGELAPWAKRVVGRLDSYTEQADGDEPARRVLKVESKLKADAPVLEVKGVGQWTGIVG
jgi:hypothetical protein